MPWQWHTTYLRYGEHVVRAGVSRCLVLASCHNNTEIDCPFK
uniref:Uncharacterized protein n=1 Tax=Setaria italica TaxID=4555 RepID=K3ZDD6_SETIT